MKSPIIKYMAAIAISLAASMAIARPSAGLAEHHFDLDPEQMVAHMAEKLDLSEDQQDQILVLLESRQDEMRSERAKLQKLQKQLMQQGDEFDSGRAGEIADDIGAITANLAYARAEDQAQISAILTEDQQAQLNEFFQLRQECRRAMGKHRRPGPS